MYELDDTKNDSNYDPNNSTSGSSEQLKDNKIPLPTIRRPKIRSMKTEISATEITKESGDNSSDAFEIIKHKRKSADNKEETRQDDKKKKPRSNNDNVPKLAQKTNQKKDNNPVKEVTNSS